MERDIFDSYIGQVMRGPSTLYSSAADALRAIEESFGSVSGRVSSQQAVLLKPRKEPDHPETGKTVATSRGVRRSTAGVFVELVRAADGSIKTK